MVDLNRAYQEAKSLPDEALGQELSNPTGFLPGYIIMSELEERQALRAGGGGQKPKGSMKDELLSSLGGGIGSPSVRQYASGGIVARTNPGYARMMALRYPEFNTKLQEENIIDAHGGIAPLLPLQAPGAAQPPVDINTMLLTQPTPPEELRQFYGGGIVSLMG